MSEEFFQGFSKVAIGAETIGGLAKALTKSKDSARTYRILGLMQKITGRAEKRLAPKLIKPKKVLPLRAPALAG